jgi:AraC family transcriptional regulator
MPEQGPCDLALDRSVLPVERALHSTPVAFIGSFACPADDPLFTNSGPARNHLVVFPRTVVTIEHADRPAFVSTPQNLTFYNRGQHYIRRAVGGAADECDFMAIAPSVLIECMRAHDPSVEEHADRPFRTAIAPAPPDVFVRERILIERLRAGAADHLEADETIIEIVDRVMQRFGQQRVAERLSASSHERVEHAKALLARNIARPISIARIAGATGTSFYHLCRIFRRATGATMTNYRLQLRLRLAFDRVLRSTDLLSTALNLGFASHSYFTHAFRSSFGLTPSALRDRGRAH